MSEEARQRVLKALEKLATDKGIAYPDLTKEIAYPKAESLSAEALNDLANLIRHLSGACASAEFEALAKGG